MKPNYILFVLFVLSSCKNEDNTGVQHRTTSDTTSVFKVSVGAIVNQDDHFSLYYTTDGSIDFRKIPAVWKAVKGKPEMQEIVFALPEKVKPTQLRIDFGKNPDQEEIQLRFIKFSYNGKAVDLPGTLIFSYFRPDVKSTDADATTGKINGLTVDGKRQTPSLYPKENPLEKQLDYLYE